MKNDNDNNNNNNNNAWLSLWKNAPTYTIAGVQELYQKLLPTMVY